MPIFTADEIQQAVSDTVKAASAPVGSQLYQGTGAIMEPIIMRGDVGDGWVYTASLCQIVALNFGLNQYVCQCDPPNPEHSPAASFGMVPILADGTLDMENAVRGNDEPPLEIGVRAPEIVTFSRMVNAELAGDDDASCRAWEQAVEGGWFVRVMTCAAKVAGEAIRAAAGRVN